MEFNSAIGGGLNAIDHTRQPNYDAVYSSDIRKFVDKVQGLTPDEVKTFGIDVTNDVYIDKPAQQRQSVQQPQQEEYTTIGEENGRDMETFDRMRKWHVN